ncbi:ABC transporter permease [Paenibacillus sp. NPDC058910]|uniref:ABC transporter permease n=1 Tax=unclassified Paenibacillus TaxID=185978 RepID=UPI0036BDF19E
MSIFRHTVKRIFKHKLQLLFIVLFPLIYMSLGLVDDKVTMKAAVIDHDQTELTKSLTARMESMAEIRTVKEDQIKQELKELKVDYVLVIDKGFTDRLLQGGKEGLTEYSIRESNLSNPLSSYLQMWVGRAESIAAETGNQPEHFYTAYEQYDKHGSLRLEHNSVQDQTKSHKVLGFLITPMLYTSLIAGIQIISNRNNRTLYRTLIAPVRISSYMFQMIVSFIFVAIIQLTFAMLVLKWGYGIDMEHSEWSLYAFLILFSVVAVSFGVAISSISKSALQACLIGICLYEPISMLGGSYGPLDWAPDVVKTISQFTPVYWVMRGIDQLLHGQTLLTLGKEALMLFLFAVIFFLLSTIKKVDIAK